MITEEEKSVLESFGLSVESLLEAEAKLKAKERRAFIREASMRVLASMIHMEVEDEEDSVAASLAAKASVVMAIALADELERRGL